MRIITPEEDKLLQDISFCKSEIEKCELDLMTYQSQEEGLVSRRQSQNIRFLVLTAVELAFLFLVACYLVVMFSFDQVILGTSLFFAGGCGLVTILYSAYYITQFFKYLASVSENSFAHSIYSKYNWDYEHIIEEEKKNRKLISQMRIKISALKNRKNETEKEYCILRDKYDDEYEHRTGRYSTINDSELFDRINNLSNENKFSVERKADGTVENATDFSVANAFLSTDDSNYFKLQADFYSLSNEKTDIEEEIIEMESKKAGAKKILFGVSVFVLAAAVIFGAFVMYDLLNPHTVENIDVMKTVGLIGFIFALVIYLIVLFVLSPYFKSGFIAKGASKFTGGEFVNEKVAQGRKRINDIDARLIEMKEEMALLKSEMKK